MAASSSCRCLSLPPASSPSYDDGGQVVDDVQAVSELRCHQGHLERVMVYYNPAKAQTNRQVREERLVKAEAEVAKIQR